MDQTLETAYLNGYAITAYWPVYAPVAPTVGIVDLTASARDFSLTAPARDFSLTVRERD